MPDMRRTPSGAYVAIASYIPQPHSVERKSAVPEPENAEAVRHVPRSGHMLPRPGTSTAGDDAGSGGVEWNPHRRKTRAPPPSDDTPTPRLGPPYSCGGIDASIGKTVTFRCKRSTGS